MLINFDTKAPLPYNLLCFLLAVFRRQMQDAGEHMFIVESELEGISA